LNDRPKRRSGFNPRPKPIRLRQRLTLFAQRPRPEIAVCNAHSKGANAQPPWVWGGGEHRGGRVAGDSNPDDVSGLPGAWVGARPSRNESEPLRAEAKSAGGARTDQKTKRQGDPGGGENPKQPRSQSEWSLRTTSYCKTTQPTHDVMELILGITQGQVTDRV
jgi:hypothetical protein